MVFWNKYEQSFDSYICEKLSTSFYAAIEKTDVDWSCGCTHINTAESFLIPSVTTYKMASEHIWSCQMLRFWSSYMWCTVAQTECRMPNILLKQELQWISHFMFETAELWWPCKIGVGR